jgi:Protein of unknown function (DUF2752)
MASKCTKRPVANRKLTTIAVATGLIAAAVIYALPPESTPYFPKCYFRLTTGLDCPGCGAARCLHSLANGDIRQAAAYNVLVLAAVPVFVYAGLRSIHARLRNRPRHHWEMPAWSIWSLIAVIVVFGVVRNLDIEPFRVLAPHRLAP